MEHRCFEIVIGVKAIGYVCKESTERVIRELAYKIFDCPILVVETLAMMEANRTTIILRMSNGIVESNS